MARKTMGNGSHAGMTKHKGVVHRTDHHHNAKSAAGGGGKAHNKVGSAGGTQSHTPTAPKAKGSTTHEKGNRPIRKAAQKGVRAGTHKHGKFSHNTVI